MATVVVEPKFGEEVPPAQRPLTICHFTTAHTDMKSRSFHRQMMPLAARGIKVRYLSPMKGARQLGNVTLVPLPRRQGRIGRMLTAPGLLRPLLRQKADVYHFQDTELLPVAFALKLIFRKRVVYDAYEDFPAMFEAKASIPRCVRPIAAKIVGAAERFAAFVFDGLMTADPLTLRRLARVNGSKKLVLYNFPNLDLFPAPISRPKTFDVVYRGGLSERAGTYLLLDAMRILASDGRRIRLLLLGYFDDSIAEKRLRGRIRELGLESSVEIRGRIDHEEMAGTLSQASIGVCPLQAVPKFMRNIPVKVFEYWACGIPAVASDLPPIRPFFHGAGAGLLCTPDQSDEWAHAIARLLDNPQWAARMGRRGRNLVVQRLNNECEIRKLRRFCAEIAAQASARTRT